MNFIFKNCDNKHPQSILSKSKMSSNTLDLFEGLPNELQQSILNNINSPNDLFSLANAYPSVAESFCLLTDHEGPLSCFPLDHIRRYNILEATELMRFKYVFVEIKRSSTLTSTVVRELLVGSNKHLFIGMLEINRQDDEDPNKLVTISNLIKDFISCIDKEKVYYLFKGFHYLDLNRTIETSTNTFHCEDILTLYLDFLEPDDKLRGFDNCRIIMKNVDQVEVNAHSPKIWESLDLAEVQSQIQLHDDYGHTPVFFTNYLETYDFINTSFSSTLLNLSLDRVFKVSSLDFPNLGVLSLTFVPKLVTINAEDGLFQISKEPMVLEYINAPKLCVFDLRFYSTNLKVKELNLNSELTCLTIWSNDIHEENEDDGDIEPSLSISRAENDPENIFNYDFSHFMGNLDCLNLKNLPPDHKMFQSSKLETMGKVERLSINAQSPEILPPHLKNFPVLKDVDVVISCSATNDKWLLHPSIQNSMINIINAPNLKALKLALYPGTEVHSDWTNFPIWQFLNSEYPELKSLHINNVFIVPKPIDLPALERLHLNGCFEFNIERNERLRATKVNFKKATTLNLVIISRSIGVNPMVDDDRDDFKLILNHESWSRDLQSYTIEQYEEVIVSNVSH